MITIKMSVVKFRLECTFTMPKTVLDDFGKTPYIKNKKKNMKLEELLIIVFSIFVNSVTGQNQIQVEDKNNLYWQPDVKINYSHFQSKSDTDCIKYKEKYGLKMSANIELKGIIDIPKSHLSSKIKKRTGNDKLYLAPLFCKNCSCIISQDSFELKVYQLLFDVAEMYARSARRELQAIQKQMNINNVNTMFFTTIKNKWDKKMRGSWASICQDVLFEKNDTEYIKWRKLVDELSEKVKDYSTQPDDLKRLINGTPIEQDYLQAKTIIGDFKKKVVN
jgi:hypothetical protein